MCGWTTPSRRRQRRTPSVAVEGEETQHCECAKRRSGKARALEGGASSTGMAALSACKWEWSREGVGQRGSGAEEEEEERKKRKRGTEEELEMTPTKLARKRQCGEGK